MVEVSADRVVIAIGDVRYKHTNNRRTSKWELCRRAWPL